MKTDISRISHRTEQRYSGVYQQQGRMLTDADWNELVDILKAQLRDALRCVVGSGTPSLGGLSVKKGEDNTLHIQPGWLFAEGVQARLGGEGPLTLGTSSNIDQPDFPGSPPLQTGITLYADVWERSITALDDSGLLDPAMNGADTCTRSRTMLQVKWMPTPRWQDRSRWLPPLGNGLLEAKACQPAGSEASVDEEDNYLFRVEVHDVVRDAADGKVTGFTLKWSRENAAQQYSLNLPDSDGTRRLGVDFLPDDFLPQQGDSKHWAYELFNEASECHIGVHLATGFDPIRGHLIRGPGQVSQEFSNTQNKCYDRISRWDGWVKVLGLASSPTSPIQVEGIDRGQPLQLPVQADKHGDVRVAYGSAGTDPLTLELLLERLQLKLTLDISNPGAMVAGDHWLLPVRSGQPPKNAAPPQGIRHHYTKLAELDTNGQLIEPNAGSEEAQHVAFRSLTELSGSGHTQCH